MTSSWIRRDEGWEACVPLFSEEGNDTLTDELGPLGELAADAHPQPSGTAGYKPYHLLGARLRTT